MDGVLHAHLTYRTVAHDHGQSVLWRRRRTDDPRRTPQQVADPSFEQMVVEQQVLCRAPYGDIRRDLRRDLGI